MADTSYQLNDPETVKVWARKLDREALKRTYMKRFMGSDPDGGREDSNAMITIKNQLNKGPGDRIRVTLRKQLKGRGVTGDGTLEGNEESLGTFTQDLLIDQLRHAVRSDGQMTEQRVTFSLRNEGMQGLADWWAERWDIWGFYHLAGYTPGNTTGTAGADTDATGSEYNGHNTITAPTRIVRITGATTDQGMTTAHNFSLVLLDKAIENAKVGQTGVGKVPIRPLMVEGKPYFVVFLHPYQVTDLRTRTTATTSHPILWYDIHKAALSGGRFDNPIFNGALGEYNGCILHESTHVPPGVHSTSGLAVSTARRAVLAGAQAAVCGFGQGHDKSTYDWFEQRFDYGNKLGVKAGCISGIKKSTYTESGTPHDFGVVVMSSYAVAHT
jgi:N4-gp56 family major capsid protein